MIIIKSKRDTQRPELTWSHYRRLISVENEAVRQNISDKRG